LGSSEGSGSAESKRKKTISVDREVAGFAGTIFLSGIRSTIFEFLSQLQLLSPLNPLQNKSGVSPTGHIGRPTIHSRARSKPTWVVQRGGVEPPLAGGSLEKGNVDHSLFQGNSTLQVIGGRVQSFVSDEDLRFPRQVFPRMPTLQAGETTIMCETSGRGKTGNTLVFYRVNPRRIGALGR
jgi:hypothetical protein